MKKGRLGCCLLLVICVSLLFLSPLVRAADLTVRWQPTDRATGYRIYQSVDGAQTWSIPLDVGNITEVILTSVPEDGMVHFKVGAYNSIGETITEWQGVWFDATRRPPDVTKGLGIH